MVELLSSCRAKRAGSNPDLAASIPEGADRVIKREVRGARGGSAKNKFG